MSPDRFIDCPDPRNQRRQCTLPFCLANPNAPVCVQARRSTRSNMVATSRSEAMGDPQGPLYKALAEIIKNTRNKS